MGSKGGSAALGRVGKSLMLDVAAMADKFARLSAGGGILYAGLGFGRGFRGPLFVTAEVVAAGALIEAEEKSLM